jgi:hypothetical protein
VTRRTLIDRDAERALLGSMLVWVASVDAASGIVDIADFGVPAHAAVFDACLAEWRSGVKPSATLVLDRLDEGTVRALGGPGGMVGLQGAGVGPEEAARYAQVVAGLARRRQLAQVAAELTEGTYDPSCDVGDLVDRAKAQLADIDVPGVGGAAPVSLDALVDSEDEDYDWVIPGLLERLDRMLLIGPRGYGKTTLWRQVAVMAGQGLHPFTFEPIAPVRTLLLDFENPPRLIRRNTRPVVQQARWSKGDRYAPDQAFLWHRPEGVDILSRVGRRAVEKALADVQPDLVCAGPFYKMFRKRAGDKYEDVAGELIAALDDMRVRHRCALLLEHHSTKDEETPMGSSLLMNWPEFGPSLVPEEKNHRDVLLWSHWRGPRDERRWPKKLVRGDIWPWHAVFDDVVPARQESA